MPEGTAVAADAANEAGAVAAAHGAHAGGHHHEHHWEVSWAPLVLVAGIFLAVPLGFAGYFVYQSTLMTVLCLGIGTPLIIAGIAKWVEEAMTQPSLAPGLAGIGLPIFIVSEIFIFLSMFVGYWMMRLKAETWPPEGTPHISGTLPLIMTALLVSSSIAIHIGEEKLEKKDIGGFNKWLVITLVLGTVFLGCTIYEYNHLAHVGFIPSTNAFSTAFFSITGFHASHVVVGLGTFIAVLIPALKGRTNHTFVKCASVYWHFVDVVWFFVVSQIYFW